MKSRLQDRFTRVDAAALLAFTAVWIYFILVIRYYAPFSDECLYIAVTERIVRGDRPLVDEWTMPQFYSLFLCLPYKLYITLKGSSTGVLLFVRWLFLAFNACCYWFIYARLRAHRLLGLLAAVLFCLYVPFGVPSCNYYTIPVRLLMIACLLIYSEKQKPAALIAAGVLFACAVLYQPGCAILYFAYSAAVPVYVLRHRKDKRISEEFDFCLRARTWLFFTLGVLLCAAVFLGWLIARSGLQNILLNVPNLLLTDNDHDFFAQGKTWGVFFRKLGQAVQIYGLICLIPSLAVVVLSAVCACDKNRDRRNTARKILFCLACALWILSCIQPLRNRDDAHLDSFFSMYAAPMLWFGLVCFLLCEHRNKRLLFFWIVGLGASLCVDFVSNVALSIGCPVAYIADLVFTADLVRELRADLSAEKNTKTERMRAQKKGRKYDAAVRWMSRITCACFVVWFVFTFFVENTFFPAHYMLYEPLFSFPFRCEAGPCSSLRCPGSYEENYYERLADIDTIRDRQPKNLFIYGLAPELYLYADLPCSTCSAWFMRKEGYMDRQLRYWQLHPERLPECIYVPLDSDVSGADEMLEKAHETFDPLCTFTVEQGQCGFILSVSQWNPELGQAAYLE